MLGEIKKLTPKQKDYFKKSQARINILYGAVRTGKTSISNIRFLYHVLHHPYNQFMITGTTNRTIQRNILSDLFPILDKIVEYKTQSYNEEIVIIKYKNTDIKLDKHIHLIGTGKIDAVTKIKGMTVAGWYGDEVTEMPKEVFDMCLSRCSKPNSKIFLTTNPSSPYHFLYTDYIEKVQDNNGNHIRKWHLKLTDNIYLPDEYIESLKKEYGYSSTSYKRYILGEWVNAEGLIYDTFDPSKHVIPYSNKLIENLNTINISCDYGSSSANVFGAIGIKFDAKEGNTYYLLDEIYYDFEENRKGLTDNDRLEQILELQYKYGLSSKNTVFLPHDAKSLKDLCIQDKRLKMRTITYKPNTYEDIQKIQSLFDNDKFYMTSNCVNSIKQFQLYSWDSKAQARGEDKPLKKDDHCPDMVRGGLFGSRKRGYRVQRVV